MKLTEDNRYYFETVAILAGVSFLETGNIKSSFINKFLTEYELGDRINVQELKALMGEITEDEQLYSIFEKASKGDITVEAIKDIAVPFGEDNGLSDEMKTDDVFKVVTPYITDKHVTQATVSELRKLRKEFTAQKYLSEEIARAVGENILYDMKQPTNYEPNFETLPNRTAVITPADWHIGAVIDNIDGNNYNFAIFETRLNEYIAKCQHYIAEFRCSEVYLIHLGDILEGIDMRKINQPYETEFKATNQLALAIKMYVRMINEIASLGVKVHVGGVGGNHDRFTSNKKEAIYGDNFMYNVIDTLLLLESEGVFPENVAILDNRDDIYELHVKIQGQMNVFTHGDNEKPGNKIKTSNYIKDYVVDNVWFGHYHSMSLNQENYARFSYMVGSIMGNNSYSKTIKAPTTKASQTISVLGKHEDGTPEKYVIPVFFTV